ncbi:hypothetical protein [Bradyrhizobium elkanii]|uniref:hypothetical protein n=1 Tax=Bradyrhizobium elkanii TaxID=29448 RepID=UPI003D1A14A6
MSFLTGSSDAGDVKKLADNIAALKSKHASVTSQLADARGSLLTITETGQRHCADGDAAASTKDIAEITRAETRIRLLESTLTRLDAEVRDAIRAHDHAVRQRLADKIAKDKASALKELSRKISVAASALADLHHAAEPLVGDSFLVKQVAELVAMLPADLERARVHAEEEVRFMIEGLRNGTISPPIPHTEQSDIATIEVDPEIETRRVLVLADCKWQHGDDVRTAGKHGQADLPISTANRAVALGYAVEVNSQRFRALSAGYIMPPRPNTKGLIDLDDENLQPPKPVFGADQFAVASGMREVITFDRN